VQKISENNAQTDGQRAVVRVAFALNAVLHAASPPSRALSAVKASKPRETSGEIVPSWAHETDLVKSSHAGKADEPHAAIAADQNPKSALAEKCAISC